MYRAQLKLIAIEFGRHGRAFFLTQSEIQLIFSHGLENDQPLAQHNRNFQQITKQPSAILRVQPRRRIARLWLLLKGK